MQVSYPLLYQKGVSILYMRVLKLLYNGFIWGLLAAVLAFQNTWLEMRINIGYIIPMLMALVLIAGLLIGEARRGYKLIGGIDFKFSAANLLLCSTAALLILGVQRLAIVPAAIVREGIRATGISFTVINIIITAVLLIGAAVLALNEKQYRSKQRR